MIRTLLVGFTLALAAPRGWTQSFNIDVGEPGSQPSANYAGAGLAGVWNSVTAEHVTPFTTGTSPQDALLVDIHGNPTNVGFHQFGGMDLVTTSDPSLGGDDARLLNDHLTTHSLVLENCMYLNGLQDGMYEVITYAWMPNSPTTQQLVRFDFVPGNTSVGGAWPGAHVEGTTYSRDIVEVTSGFLGFHVGIPSGGQTVPGAAFNGFQLRRISACTVLFPGWAIAFFAALLALGGAGLLRRV